MILVCIKDSKSGSYGSVTCSVNKETALRDAKTLVNDTRPTLTSLYPTDFELWQVGVYEPKTGIIESKLEFIIGLGDLKESKEA